MSQKLQKASVWKRAAAFLVDGIVMVALAVGFGAAFMGITHFDDHNQRIQAAYVQYETEYGISFELTEEEYLSMPQQRREQFDQAYAALIADEEAMYAYSMTIYLAVLITIASLLLAVVLLEFVGPLLLGNGQTLGKKLFGLKVVGIDGSEMTMARLFLRTIVGKFTIELMIPVLLVVLMFLQIVGVAGLFGASAVILLQVILLGNSKSNMAIHDRLAKTVVVDQTMPLLTDDPEEERGE